ncbi:hypothetical protein KFL_004790020 [Klebsormidium nitens]|uniref:Complex 1 LYR protein n=1 Tax=Klebsormidium nitens TaxID=105231 RepID=A0A1Y1ILM3_KLENI|nr:hypothetical protein KFL_004790020 [Klebsormidium nitens]|eukprot:GAQ89008.1 hypothetical protein KFL_004790020 [Klebsormidium nitens]
MAARAAYRHILRTVDSHITSVNNNQQWKDHIRTLFRAGASEPNATEAAKKIELAEDYAFLVESVRLQKDLLMSYNISTARDDKNRLAQSAARVGLQLPDLTPRHTPG